jgi:predicted permease
MGPFSAFRQDLRYALRQMKRSPLFTIVAVVTLALGIGANSAVFSVVNSVLLRPLPTPDLDRVFVIRQDLPDLPLMNADLSPAEVEELAANRELFHSVAGFTTAQWNLTGTGEPARMSAAVTMGDFFRLLGVRPHLGRLYTAESSTNGGHEVVVLSYAAWQQLTGGNPSIVGTTVQLDGLPREVIGVLPAAFRYPRGAQMYKPFNYTPAWRTRRSKMNMTVLGRLQPGVTEDVLASRLRAEAARQNEQYHQGAKVGKVLFAVPLVEYLAGPLRLVLLVLTGAVGLVLLIACANVASLQLVRASGRLREMAIRKAIGAERGRIVGQLLVESLVLSFMGGLLGLVLGGAVLRLLGYLDASQHQALEGVRLDGRVLALTVVVSMLAACAFGTAPAVRAARIDPQAALRQAGPGASMNPSRHRLLTAAIVVQVALAFMLLIGAGLTVRSLAGLLDTGPGFRPGGVVTAQVALPDSRYGGVPQQAAFIDAVLLRLHGMRVIEAAGAGWALPFSDQIRDSSPFTVQGREAVAGQPELHAEYRVVSGTYFQAMGIPLLRGRTFGDADGQNAPTAVLVDEHFAKRFFPGEDPVGRQIEHARGPATIVGVVGSVSHAELGAPPEPVTYYHYRQTETPWAALVVRSGLTPAAAADAIRAAVREVDPQLPVYDVATMEGRIANSLSGRRLAALGMGAFAALSLFLALLGVYGVMEYSTRQRTREIGIRMALGARPAAIVRSVAGRGAALVGTGLLCGLGGALMLGRLISGLLYGVRPTDPTTFVVVGTLMLATGVAAAWLAARHAARVEPVVALQTD